MMKRLHTFQLWERAQAGMYKELLEAEGIACLVKNEQLFSAMGEIPFIECYPELWVVDAEAYPRARLLLHGWLNVSQEKSPNWTCGNCGEESSGNFSACWSCGQARNGQEDS